MEQRWSCQQLVLEQLETSMGKKWTSTIILYSKVSFIWSIDSKVKAKIINLPEENRRRKLCDIEVGKDFFGDNYTKLNIKCKHR